MWNTETYFGLERLNRYGVTRKLIKTFDDREKSGYVGMYPLADVPKENTPN
jgi:hypothetical protein